MHFFSFAFACTCYCLALRATSIWKPRLGRCSATWAGRAHPPRPPRHCYLLLVEELSYKVCACQLWWTRHLGTTFFSGVRAKLLRISMIIWCKRQPALGLSIFIVSPCDFRLLFLVIANSGPEEAKAAESWVPKQPTVLLLLMLLLLPWCWWWPPRSWCWTAPPPPPPPPPAPPPAWSTSARCRGCGSV